jgi:hypothetical protein
LFGECLDCEVLLVAYSFHLVDGGEASLAYLLDGLVIFVEAVLVEVSGQMADPEFDQGLMLGIEFNLSTVFLDDPEADGLGHDCLFGGSLSIEFVDGFKLEIEGKFGLVEVLGVCLVWLKDG